jgi:hypothetical protein
MSEVSVVDTSALGRKRGVRGHPKGRPLDPQAVTEIGALLGDSPRRRDLLIEFLHRIQDRYGHISAAHILALAEELKLARTEVYEVATFYHHFDVVKEGETPAPALTVRICETLSCQMAGADALRHAVERRRTGDRRALRRSLRACAGGSRRTQHCRWRDGGEGRRGDRGQAYRARAAAVHRLRRVSR